MGGEPLWQRTDFGKMTTRNGFGEGSSPTIHGGTIIVPWDHEGPSKIVAIDAASGAIKWETGREEPTSWDTPLVVAHGGKRQVVTSGQNFAMGYDFETGAELWRCPGQTQRPVASAVSADGIVYIGSGFRGAFLGAFKLGATGNLEGTDAVLWTKNDLTPDIPSLLLSNGRLYFTARKSPILSCADAKTGEFHYRRERIDGLRETLRLTSRRGRPGLCHWSRRQHHRSPRGRRSGGAGDQQIERPHGRHAGPRRERDHHPWRPPSLPHRKTQIAPEP